MVYRKDDSNVKPVRRRKLFGVQVYYQYRLVCHLPSTLIVTPPALPVRLLPRDVFNFPRPPMTAYEKAVERQKYSRLCGNNDNAASPPC